MERPLLSGPMDENGGFHLWGLVKASYIGLGPIVGAREMTLLQGYPLGCTLELETELCHDGTWNHEGELDPSTPTWRSVQTWSVWLATWPSLEVARARAWWTEDRPSRCCSASWKACSARSDPKEPLCHQEWLGKAWAHTFVPWMWSSNTWDAKPSSQCWVQTKNPDRTWQDSRRSRKDQKSARESCTRQAPKRCGCAAWGWWGRRWWSWGEASKKIKMHQKKI